MWARQMAPIAEKRSEEGALQVLAWVFGDQGGRTDYRFRVDSPDALSKKFDRIETAMREPIARRSGGGGGRGLSSQDLWQWGEELDREERARLEVVRDEG